jgi:hypothetical protein
VQAAAQSKLASVLSFGLPDVKAFAVSSLLFPGTEVSRFSQARVPGDLMLCGTIEGEPSVAPALLKLPTGGTVSFTAPTPVTWGASLGTIDGNGNYTAPTRLSRATTAVITATDTDSNHAYAAVVVVPARCLVSPLVIVTQPGYAAQPFLASLPGSSAAATWTISPAVGSIDDGGNYTPPATAIAATLVTVTATIGTSSATATVLVTPQAPSGVAVSPYATTPLAPGQTQQFAAASGGNAITPTWSLWPPAVGTIDATGLYEAPGSIATPQGVVLLAQAGQATGTAVILLAPADG